jgi:two-component system CheB/CheR fusion protein
MDASTVRVLLVEDDEDDYLLTRDLLAQIKSPCFALEWARTYAAGLAAMTGNRHDIYLLDYRLDGQTGLDLLRAATAGGSRGPAILLTGRDDHLVDVEAMQAGMADFLVKGALSAALLERSLRYALERSRAAAALRQAHDELEARVAARTAELSRANALLAEADRRKDDFLAMLAHELRSPLAPILNGLHILRLGESDPRTRDAGRAIMERQVRHLSRLIDDLLDVSRITRGKIRLQRERLDLARLARTTAEDRRPSFEQAELRLAVEVPEAPVWVSADATRLAQVLTNLLDNAVKFTDRGGAVTVHVGAEPAPPRAALTVRDTGIGIEPQVLPHLFDVFAQADRSLDRARGGLGLGLALVRGLIGLHEGTVEAASAGPGRGATFTVCLPLEPAPATLAATPAAPLPMRAHLRVLVIEDHRDSADSLRTLLELLGHEVTVAYTGAEGVAAAQTWQPEVVLCDIGLPELDGYGVAEALRRSPATAAARLIAVSGYGQEEDRRRSRQAGFDHHLVKPVAPEALQKLLTGAG